jgi:nucleoside-diphosphate-sugar epimerase
VGRKICGTHTSTGNYLTAMKKVLVTGATGFIGSYVIEALLQRGCTVIATSTNKEKAAAKPWYSKVHWTEFNLAAFNSTADYYQFFNAPDILIHLAWEGLPNYKAAFHMEENLPRHFSFLQNMVQHGLKDLTVTGTCFEYGMQEGCLAEDMDCIPANPYAIAKNELRIKLQQLQQQQSFSLKWARLFYMYGAGQNPNSLFSQLDRALANGDTVFNMSGGEQVRDFLPVEKMAAYIVSIALQRQTEGIINCCSGTPVTVKSLVEDYLAQKGQHITLNLGYYPYADYEPMRFWGDAAKLHKTIQ